MTPYIFACLLAASDQIGSEEKRAPIGKFSIKIFFLCIIHNFIISYVAYCIYFFKNPLLTIIHTKKKEMDVYCDIL